MRQALGLFKILLVTFIVVSCGGTANMLTTSAKTTSDDALYQTAVMDNNSGDYSGAITALLTASSDFRRKDYVVRTLSSAYAGRCGMNFLTMFSGLGSLGVSVTPMQSMYNMFVGITAVPADCYSSQLTMEAQFGALSTSRLSDDNLFMALLGMAKIGTYLRKDAMDPALTGALPSPGGIVAGFDACSSASISDADVQQIGSGLALILTNFSAISASLAGSVSTNFTAIQAACGALTPNPCTITDPTSSVWTSTMNDGRTVIKAIRSLIKSNDMGIQSCATSILCCP